MTGLFHKFYLLSPIILQTVGISLYGLKLYYREYGRKFQRLLEEFERHASMSAAELEAYQSEKLRLLITHCYRNVPYYRRIMQERKLTPTDFQSAADLPKLPVLTRQQMRDYGDQLIAESVRKSDLIVGFSSGTTANPIRIVWDRNVCMVKTVVDWRQKRQAGVNPFDRMAYFIGRQIVPAEVKKPPYWRQNWTLKQLFFSAFHLSEKNLGHYIDRLARFQPVAIEGFPSTLSIVAAYLNRRGESFPVKAVFTSAEPLLPNQRATIEKAFVCKVYDFLGMSERVIFATECHRHEGKHLDIDFGVTEILGEDGRPADGLGRIVATGLHNYTQPLLRYQSSDISAFYHEPCGCGRPFPRIQDVTTRDEDTVTTPDGRYLSPSALGTATKDLENVEHIQIWQEDLHTIDVRLVPRAGYREDEGDSVRQSLQKIVGANVNITVRTVSDIPRTSAGKFRWVVSKVPLKF